MKNFKEFLAEKKQLNEGGGVEVKTFHDLITAIKGLSYEEIEKIDSDIMKSGSSIGFDKILNIVKQAKI